MYFKKVTFWRSHLSFTITDLRSVCDLVLGKNSERRQLSVHFHEVKQGSGTCSPHIERQQSWFLPHNLSSVSFGFHVTLWISLSLWKDWKSIPARSIAFCWNKEESYQQPSWMLLLHSLAPLTDLVALQWISQGADPAKSKPTEKLPFQLDQFITQAQVLKLETGLGMQARTTIAQGSTEGFPLLQKYHWGKKKTSFLLFLTEDLSFLEKWGLDSSGVTGYIRLQQIKRLKCIPTHSIFF